MDAEPSPSPNYSQENFIPLLQLDPSPIDSPPTIVDADDFRKDLGSLPRHDGDDDTNAPAKAPSTGAPGLSSSSSLTSSTSSGTATGPGLIFYCSSWSRPSDMVAVAIAIEYATQLTCFPVMRVQKFSSYAMGLFTSLHLANVSLIPAVTRSVPGSETYLLMTREIYQTSLTEPILVALPVVAHVGSGIALRLLRRRQNLQKYGGATPGRTSPWPPLSYISMSGYAFAVFYSAHVFVNRVLPLQVEGDSSNIGLAYVAHGFARHPVIARIAYIGLLAVGCGHMIWGQAKWLGIAPSTKEMQRAGAMTMEKRKKHRRRWLGLHGASAAFAALWAVGGLAVVARGGLMEGWIGRVYDDMFEAIGL